MIFVIQARSLLLGAGPSSCYSPTMIPLLALAGLGALVFVSSNRNQGSNPNPRASVGRLSLARVGLATDVPAPTFTHPEGEPETQPTRASCTECVDKHLGAAWINMTEHRDGYPHRLRAIGHLHEAEDESQHWPALHVAVREARKRYQQEGVVPDFGALAALVDAVRAGKVESV